MRCAAVLSSYVNPDGGYSLKNAGGLCMPQQFGLNVSRLPDVNPSTRIRQAVDARCRWVILRYRHCYNLSYAHSGQSERRSRSVDVLQS